MLLRKTSKVPFHPSLQIIQERPRSNITSTYTQQLSRVLMRTRACGRKKDSEGNQMSQEGLLGSTCPKLRKKELDFLGMDLQSVRSGKKRIGSDVIYIQQTS